MEQTGIQKTDCKSKDEWNMDKRKRERMRELELAKNIVASIYFARMPHPAQAKAKAAKEKAIHDLCLSNLRGDSRLAWKEEVAAKKAARDPGRVVKR